MDGDELDAEDAWQLARRIGLRRLAARLVRAVPLRRRLQPQPGAGAAGRPVRRTVPAGAVRARRRPRPRAARPGGGADHRAALPRRRRRGTRWPAAVTSGPTGERAGEHRARPRAVLLAALDDHRDGARSSAAPTGSTGSGRDRPALAKYGRGAGADRGPRGAGRPPGSCCWWPAASFADAMRTAYGWSDTHACRVWNLARWPVGLALLVVRHRGAARPRPAAPAARAVLAGARRAAVSVAAGDGGQRPAGRLRAPVAARSARSTARWAGCSRCCSGRCSARSRCSPAPRSAPSWSSCAPGAGSRSTTTRAARTGSAPTRTRAADPAVTVSAWTPTTGTAVRRTGLVWSETPNQFVAEELADLPPGRAVDLAAGEGRNAIWLARRGWEVTAVDFSRVALDKGRRLAGDDARRLAVRRRDDLAGRRGVRPRGGRLPAAAGRGAAAAVRRRLRGAAAGRDAAARRARLDQPARGHRRPAGPVGADDAPRTCSATSAGRPSR